MFDSSTATSEDFCDLQKKAKLPSQSFFQALFCLFLCLILLFVTLWDKLIRDSALANDNNGNSLNLQQVNKKKIDSVSKHSLARKRYDHC